MSSTILKKCGIYGWKSLNNVNISWREIQKNCEKYSPFFKFPQSIFLIQNYPAGGHCEL